jgi:hypothetical protein
MDSNLFTEHFEKDFYQPVYNRWRIDESLIQQQLSFLEGLKSDK